MQISIIGLPKSGKTTIFNVVTRGKAEVAAYQDSEGKPNVGVAKVPDQRLHRLEVVYRPKRVVPAEVTYVDIPAAPDGLGKTRGLAGEHLNHLQRADALLVVVRAFDDPSVSHVDDTVDPFRDVETALLELAFADLEIVDRRLARLADASKGTKATERDALDRECSVLERIRVGLEAGESLRDMIFTAEEGRMLEGFRLLTAKPVVIVANVGEDQMSEAVEVEERLASAASGLRVRTAALCGRLEMELSQMDLAEEQEFRAGLDAGEPGLERIIGISHDVADLITFFTGNQNHVRAWTVPRGATALKAAGRVHSDFERGFIRAEVVSFEDLDTCGSVAEARKQGLLRQEGKEYLVQEGDILNILFNV